MEYPDCFPWFLSFAILDISSNNFSFKGYEFTMSIFFYHRAHHVFMNKLRGYAFYKAQTYINSFLYAI
ncbi:hypothetical protein CLV99_4396 [Sphingobacterium yanglingense]|uniref:Uncharacterized protein n=1 Tax=Sphingobacterium yanglingense TaxID=1437280 RepID=A0A4R6W455_9SPHI|nr:hypothetical protein CLV99_4396 [Sphingobacterium yanglingense]